MKRKILIATTTRADWGLLAPIATALRGREDCTVEVMATNMHLDPRRGMTLREVRAAGFEPLIAEMDVDCPTAEATARSMGQCLAATAEVLGRVEPDLVVILGDRFEALAIASAAAVMRVPIVHLHGGELTIGAFDDCFRHAITKLSALHLTATEQYRRRVISLGEEPRRVINVGAIGVRPRAPMSRRELEADLGWEFGEEALLLTLHPETLSEQSAGALARATFEALDRFPGSRLLITYPNNDPGAEEIIAEIERYEARRPAGEVKIVASLGAARYFSALRCVRAVIGNSSSGIIEVPSAGIATVNIGHRQDGRVRAESVIDCRADADSIAEAIGRALAGDFSGVSNPYEQPDTLEKITDAIAGTPLELLRQPKVFIDNAL